jgi:uncharacterized damage-inducible protein DinB
MDLLDLLLDHDHWATRRLLDACSSLTEAQLDQPFDIGHRTLRATFGHMIGNVPFWTAFLDERQPAAPREDARSLAELVDEHERGYAAFAGAARRLRDEGRLGEVFQDHYGVRKSYGGTALMVIEHNAEHRTEILHILQRLNAPDQPEVDLGVWDYEHHNP